MAEGCRRDFDLDQVRYFQRGTTPIYGLTLCIQGVRAPYEKVRRSEPGVMQPVEGRNG